MKPATAESTPLADSPFLSALRGERTTRRPIWIMRQAGRYLPEYLAVRKKASFLDVCQNPELACEVTLQPVQRFGFDAAILFSDILLPLTPMGAAFVFTEKGPRLNEPVRSESAIAKLAVVPAAEKMPFVADAIGMIRGALPHTPLIGFAGAPWTLAAYLVEGGGSQTFSHLKTMLYTRPDLLERLLDKLSTQIADHLAMQVRAGANAVQLFDTWAGILSPADYRRFVLPGIQRIFAALAELGVPRILFMKSGTPYLESLRQAGADAIGLDWTMDMATTIGQLDGQPVQGNLDPLALHGDLSELRRRAVEICRAADAASGHVFNLGHGILPKAPLAAVETLVETVHGYRREAGA